MNGKRKKPILWWFGILCSLAWIASAVFALGASTAENYFFQPAPYLAALKSQDVYSHIPGLVAEVTVSQAAEGGAPAEGDQLAYLTTQDYTEIYTALFPPDWIKTQAAGLLDQLFTHLNFKSDRLSLSIPMSAVKEKLNGDVGKSIVNRVVQSWPACTAQQLLEITAQGLSGELDHFPVCRPPAELMGAAQPVLGFSLEEFSASLPDPLDLAEWLPGGDAPGGIQVQRWPVYVAGRWFMRLSPLAALFCLALVTLCGVRSWRSWLGWWGVNLIAAGGIAFIGAMAFGAPVMGWLGEKKIPVEVTQSVPGLVVILQGVIHALAQGYCLRVALAGAGMLVIGILFCAGWAIVKLSYSAVK